MESTLEEGELTGTQLHPGVAADEFTGFNRAYEWPGDSPSDGSGFGPYSEAEPSSLSSRSNSNSLKAGHPIFRLVVQRSLVINTHTPKLAVIDSYHEVQLGRDSQGAGSTTPRVRLKEMEVSKVHATLYWDGTRRGWNVVDMGSKHGTFVFQASRAVTGSNSSAPSSEIRSTEGPELAVDHDEPANVGARLSKPRVASLPWSLRHADRLTIGSTTFVVHLHDNQRPCHDCSLEGKEELSLYPHARSKRSRDVAGLDAAEETVSMKGSPETRDPKKALTMLKRSLLTRHSAGTPPVASTSTEYTDRAARRRMMYAGSQSDGPGVSTMAKSPSPVVALEPISKPPTPLPSSNIGHRLLMKQGWSPGAAIGLEDQSLVEPLEVKTTQNRTGLGMKPALDWKEHEKLKRFRSQR